MYACMSFVCWILSAIRYEYGIYALGDDFASYAYIVLRKYQLVVIQKFGIIDII